MESFNLDETLWQKALGTPLTLSQSGGLTSLALAFPCGLRLPDDGFSVASSLEVFLVLSGEIQLGLEDGEHTIGPGILTVLQAGEKHYARNAGSEPAKLVQFTLPS